MRNIIKTPMRQLREERQRNEALAAALAKQQGQIEFIAIMGDIDIGEQEGESHEYEY